MGLVIISGKSGSGKNTIANMLIDQGYERVVSYTTRRARETETDGVDYNFISNAEFENLIAENKLKEWIYFDGAYYGSPNIDISKKWVAILDPKGVKDWKDTYGSEVIAIWLSASQRTLAHRMSIRARNYFEVKQMNSRLEKDDEFFGQDRSSFDCIIDANVGIQEVFAKVTEALQK